MGTSCFLIILGILSPWSIDCTQTSDFGIENNQTSDVYIYDSTLALLSSWWLIKFIPSVYTIIFLLSLPCNVMSIFILLFRVQVNTSSAVFLLNLALSDVIFVIFLPFNIVYRFLGNNWVIGEGMCRFVTSAFYSNMYCSILLMTSISVDRFLAVVHPVRSLLWRTVKRAWLACLFIWMVSIMGTVPLHISHLTFYIEQLNITTCYDLQDTEYIESFFFPYFTTFIFTFFFLPFVITTFCYMAIIRRLSTPKIESPFRKSRSVFLCITVLFEFIICFGPTNILFLVYHLSFSNEFNDTVYFVYMISSSISSISCCLDPVIYYYGSSKFKKHFYGLMNCCKIKSDYKQADTQDTSACTR